MEFHFDVNQVLPEDITVVDSTLHSFKAHHIREKGCVLTFNPAKYPCSYEVDCYVVAVSFKLLQIFTHPGCILCKL